MRVVVLYSNLFAKSRVFCDPPSVYPCQSERSDVKVATPAAASISHIQGILL